MTQDDDAIRLTVRWLPQDFNAYIGLDQRMRALLAPRSTAAGGLAAALTVVAMYFAIPSLVAAALALWWGAGRTACLI